MTTTTKPTTILDTIPARVWIDRIDGPRGWGHGYELVQMMAGLYLEEHGIPGIMGDPTRNATEVIDALLAQGRIRQDVKPSPTLEQRWGGTGGTFAVSGRGAPVTCWRYFRGW